jgi:hypothetical protein
MDDFIHEQWSKLYEISYIIICQIWNYQLYGWWPMLGLVVTCYQWQNVLLSQAKCDIIIPSMHGIKLLFLKMVLKHFLGTISHF